MAWPVVSGLVLHEDLGDIRMADRLAGGVRQQVLLGDVGDVFSLRILREQMIERLILARADLRRNRLIPFFSVVEFRVDVEHHTSKRIDAVTHHLTDLELGAAGLAHARTEIMRDCKPRQRVKGCSAPLWPGPWLRPGGRGRELLWPASKLHRPASCRRS